MFEHALHARPRLEHGYCTDDVARALLVVMREPSRTPELERLGATCLSFLVRAQLPDGRFHNRLSATPERRWLDEVGSDDSNGRALWGLGTAVALATTQEMRRRALSCFEAGAGLSSPWPRTNAYAVLGAVEALAAHPRRARARKLLETAAARLGSVQPDPDWPWPEARLAYDNARLAEARIAAGVALRDQGLVGEGVRLLDWLVDVETRGDRFSFTPIGGWALGEPRPGFDQQPIEAGSMADACARAFDATGEPRWADAALRAAAWFLGENDAAVPLLDPATGGCRDGLGPEGCNGNQGAESTLALIAALQQARRLQAAARSALTASAASTLAAPTQRSAAPNVR